MSRVINNFANLPVPLIKIFAESFEFANKFDTKIKVIKIYEREKDKYTYECRIPKISPNYKTLSGYIPDYETYVKEIFVPNTPWNSPYNILKTDFGGLNPTIDDEYKNYESTARDRYNLEYLFKVDIEIVFSEVLPENSNYVIEKTVEI